MTKIRQGIITQPPVERAFLVGVERKAAADWSGADSLKELSHLATTAGAEIVGMLIQRLERPSPRYYLGKGKLEELIATRSKIPYDVVIFDDELSPRQQRNLEEILGSKVIDRTALILDIFAKRAHTYEGQIQVELAQHQYLLPRLPGQWSHLERLGGGIGTRGPGESQLETDRRLIRRRIHRLKAEIEAVRKHRALYRQKRQKSGIPVVALVGYTNAGKTTLFNALCNTTMPVEDKLFVTLDPVSRRLKLLDGQPFLLTDTVGFIHKLPLTIVAAFRATLEELTEASLLLHVVDITHPKATEQCQVVEETLKNLNLATKPRVTVFNKADLVVEGEKSLKTMELTLAKERVIKPEDKIILVSALKGWGVNELLKKIGTCLSNKFKIIL